MCQEATKPVRRVTLYEGQVRFIMERETPEERLAAWETVAAIAFPPDDAHKYVPPALPTDGGRLSPCDRVRRDVYNFIKDIIEYQAMKDSGKLKDSKKVEAGRLGAAVRFGRRGESSSTSQAQEPVEPPDEIEALPTAPRNEPQSVADDDYRGYVAGGFRHKKSLTKDEQAAVSEWDRKIPDAKALQAFLKKNYMYQNKKLVVSDEFCDFAYHKLAKIDRWLSTRDQRPLHDIRQAVHYIALDYIKRAGEIRRAEKEEQRKDLEADFEMKNTQYSQQSSSELATIERKRRRAAEKEAMAKILKGEL